jgi:small subunit ribosomal protein S17
MADESTNEETQDEAAAEPEVDATDAPDGVADVENVPEEAAPEESEATTAEPEASAEPEPNAEPEPESTEEPAEGPPADEMGEPVAEAAEPATEPEPTEEAAEGSVEGAAAAEPKRKKKRLPRAQRRQRSKPVRERPAERKAIIRLPKPEHERGRRQERQGTVVSAAADKTIVVRVDVVKVHPMYKKVVKRSTKLHAHDEANEAKIGDVVRVVETRPLSKLKRWRLQEVVKAAK